MAEVDLRGKRVFIRADLNVPQDDAGKISDDTRIRASVPAIKLALEQGAAVMVTSHLGRPTEGELKPEDSLAPVAKRLSELLKVQVPLIKDWVGGVEVKPGQVVMLENCRVNKGEKKDDEGLARKIAALCDVYVNDAFGTAHRAEATTHGAARFAKVACAGPLMAAELDALGKALADPKRPFVAIIGGAKVSGKIDVIEALLPKVDTLVVGGGMAFTFYKAQGKEIGGSLVEEDRVEMAGALLAKAGSKLVLPVDTVVTDAFDFDARKVGALKTVAWDKIGAKDIGVDIGEATRAKFAGIVKGAKTVVWNGPMGVFEIDATAKGTLTVAQALAEATSHGAITVVGGGDSVAAIEKNGLENAVSHVSTGGGASLEFLEGKELPGVTYLSDK